MPDCASRQTKAVDFVALFADDLSGRIESNAGIALDVDDARDLDLGRLREGVFVSAQAILQVRLVGHGKDDDVALTFEFLRQTLSASEPGLIIVGADEEEPLARGRVGINRDYGDAGGHRLVDAVFEQRCIGHGQQNAGRFLLHRLIESIALGFGIVSSAVR